LITCSGRQQDGLYDRLFAGSCYANGDHWAIVLYYRTSGRVATQMRRAHVTSRSRPSCSTWTRPALRKRPMGPTLQARLSGWTNARVDVFWT